MKMYNRLPLDFIGVTEYFGTRQDPITKVTSYHYAIDLGWNKYQGEPIYAINDGEVVLESFDNNLGNYIVLMHDYEGKRIITRYLHMKARSKLKKGDKVKQKQVIGHMGTTGYSTGTHLHFEYWICPKGYKYNYADRSKYAKDPLQYCYLFEDQTASSKTKNILKVVGNPTTKQQNISQLKVVKKYLNCRSEPTTTSKILGYINEGYYNILEKQQKKDYTWYKIDTNKWLADVDKSFEIYEVNEEKEEDCKKQQQENEELKQEIKKQNEIIKQLEKNQETTFFTSPKSAYYYIYLEENETINFNIVKK